MGKYRTKAGVVITFPEGLTDDDEVELEHAEARRQKHRDRRKTLDRSRLYEQYRREEARYWQA